MIISKTPHRVSFFGGGTDFPEYFERYGGAVLGTAIDKFIYHAVMHFPSELFDYAIRLSYSKLECVPSVDDIEHKPFREILRYCGIERDVEVDLMADLPALSGLGASSSFTVGLLNALHAFQGKFVPQYDLARIAIHVERNVLKEPVGCQDQIFAAYGGLSLIEFTGADEFVVNRVSLSKNRLNELDSSLLLFFSGIKRRSADLEQKKIQNIEGIRDRLKRMRELVDEAHSLLTGTRPLSEFGRLLDATWREKRELAPGVSTPVIDDMYNRALDAGALGGKLLGAGGGGFVLLFVPPEKQSAVRKALSGFYEVPFSINAHGSAIIHS